MRAKNIFWEIETCPELFTIQLKLARHIFNCIKTTWITWCCVIQEFSDQVVKISFEQARQITVEKLVRLVDFLGITTWKLSMLNQDLPIFLLKSTLQSRQLKRDGAAWTFCQWVSRSPFIMKIRPQSEQGFGDEDSDFPSSKKSENRNVWFWGFWSTIVLTVGHLGQSKRA